MSLSPKSPFILVIGSINMDLMLQCSHLPRAGETVLGQSFKQASGGKGANQAVAAARLEANVALIACIGDDAYGRESRLALDFEGINTEYITTIAESSTGIAMVTSDSQGENCISLAPGANAYLQPRHLDFAENLFAKADLVVCQLEVPLDTVRHALRLGKAHQVPTVLNPAPVQELEIKDLIGVDTLILNSVEASMLSKLSVDTPQQATLAAHALHASGVSTVVITLGSAGAIAVDASGAQHFTATKVNAVDTTGAGDTFVGAFVTARASAESLSKAMDFAQRAAAFSVTRRGAQASMPRLSELKQWYVNKEVAV